MNAEFDRMGSRYEELVQQSIAFSGREHEFFLEAKARRLIDLVRRRVGAPGGARALDVGCGNGSLHTFLGGFGTLEAVDPSQELIAEASRLHPNVRYEVANGTALPHADGTFDLSFTVCVLHHVELELRPVFAAELARVTRAGGLVVVFEHNPFNPLTRLAVSRCAFDEDAVLLRRRETSQILAHADVVPVEERYILFFPFRSRLVDQSERVLAQLPLGAQYYVAALA